MGKVDLTRSEQLNVAQANKKDEFYTQLEDIEKEVVHYKKHFKGKTVFCNCDNPKESNFAKYFKTHFEELGLNKLICACYKKPKGKIGQYSEFYGNGRKEETHRMKGDGDFRGQESLELLKLADIVVTNPPFSLFRDFIKIMVNYDKKFLIIGNLNAVSYKQCFELIAANKMWLGCSIHAGDREFRVPQDYPLEAATCREDSNGNKYIRVKGVRWFTNLDYEERFKDLNLVMSYYKNKEMYPKFDNYNAINVGKTKDIPKDYKGVMGVPISFLDHYNPEQFEIIGNEYTQKVSSGRCYINGSRQYSRIFIKRRLKVKKSQKVKQAVMY